MIDTILTFIKEILIFEFPVFFTFKFLMSKNQLKICKILKFWCVLSLYFLIDLILSNIIAGSIFPYLSLAFLVGLVFEQFKYSEYIYDKMLAPLYRENKQHLQKISQSIQKMFNKNTQQLKTKVAQSAGSKIKGFLGQLLVGTINPNSKSKKQQQEQKNQSDSDKQD